MKQTHPIRRENSFNKTKHENCDQGGYRESSKLTKQAIPISGLILEITILRCKAKQTQIIFSETYNKVTKI